MALLWDFFKQMLISARAGSVLRRVTWLSLIGMFFSVSALILVMSVMNALNQNIRNRTLSVEPHLTIEFLKASSFKQIELDPVTLKVKQTPGARFSLLETQDVILRTMDGRFRGAAARGLTWESLQASLEQIKKLQMNYQSSFSDLTVTRPEKGEIIMGVDLAHGLNVITGDVLTVVAPEGLLLPPSEMPRFEKIKVRQILSTNLSDIDSQNIFYIQGEALHSLKDSASRKLGLEVWLDDLSRAEDLKEQWTKLDPNIRVMTWKDRNSAIFFALRLEKIMIGLFLSLASFVAGLSLLTVLSLLISQKHREIALLQVLGLSHRKVQLLFQRLGLLVAAIGLGGGVIFGIMAGLYIEAFPLNVLPDIYYDRQIPAQVDFTFVLWVVVLGIILAVSGSWFAARSAAKYSLSQALRMKL